MTALLARLERWLLGPAAASRLAGFRIAVGVYALGWLAVVTPELLGLADLDTARMEPVGAVAWLRLPAPSTVGMALLLAVAAGSGLAFAAGWQYRTSAPAFALALLLATSYQNSWGKLLHTENLLVVHVVVLALSPAADARVLGSRRRRPSGTAYGWPIRAMALATACSYLAAGITKLRLSGMDWLDPENLRNWVAYDLVRKELFGDPYVPIAVPALEHTWLFIAPVLFTLAVELGAPLALLSRRIAIPWAVAAWSLHAAILLAMSVAFPYHLTGIPLLAVLLARSGRGRSDGTPTHEVGARGGGRTALAAHDPKPPAGIGADPWRPIR
jgi:HTTM domain